MTLGQAIKELGNLGWTNIHQERPRSSCVWATPPQGGKPVLADARDLLAEIQAQ